MASIGIMGLLSIASTGLGVMSQVAQGNTQNAIAKSEADRLEKKAMFDRATGQHKAERRRKEGEKLASTQNAAMAASGGGYGTSSYDILGDTTGTAELNALMEEAQGNENASNQEDQAVIKRAGGKAAKRAGGIKAFGTFLTGASKFAGNNGLRAF